MEISYFPGLYTIWRLSNSRSSIIDASKIPLNSFPFYFLFPHFFHEKTYFLVQDDIVFDSLWKKFPFVFCFSKRNLSNNSKNWNPDELRQTA